MSMYELINVASVVASLSQPPMPAVIGKKIVPNPTLASDQALWPCSQLLLTWHMHAGLQCG